MEVERAQTRHGPNDLGQHAEGYHDLQVGLQGAQFLEESRVFQLLGLEDGDALTDGILLDGRSLQLRVMTANGLIGHSDDTHHIVAAFNEAAKRLNRKVGGAHVNDSHIYIIVLWLFFGKVLHNLTIGSQQAAALDETNEVAIGVGDGERACTRMLERIHHVGHGHVGAQDMCGL